MACPKDIKFEKHQFFKNHLQKHLPLVLKHQLSKTVFPKLSEVADHKTYNKMLTGQNILEANAADHEVEIYTKYLKMNCI